jgi:hypothetical protein
MCSHICFFLASINVILKPSLVLIVFAPPTRIACSLDIKKKKKIKQTNKRTKVRHLLGVPFAQVLSTIAHLVILFTLALPPMVLLNLPVGIFARITADKHMAIALAGSNVKVSFS